MSGEFTSDAVAILTYLLPGFVAAWVFYGLTSHPKPPQFERLIQALIFTFIILAVLPLVKWSLEYVGHFFSIRPWDQAAESLALLALAIALGTILALATNKDTVHKRLRRIGFTSRTSHPSEWFGVLDSKKSLVVLNLRDGRRLYGWPKEWPTDPGKGQFFITTPGWIREDGAELELPELEGILVRSEDVQWVEFLHPPQEVGDVKS